MFYRPTISLPASFGNKGGPEILYDQHLMCLDETRYLQNKCPNGYACSSSQFARDAFKTRCSGNLDRTDVCIGKRIQAGKLQRAETAAGEQNREHGRIGCVRREASDSSD